MARAVQWLGGAIFGLSLAALIPFLVEKDAEPKDHAVLWILYGALVVSALAWLVATILLKARARLVPLEIEYSLDSSDELKISLRADRPQLVLLCVAIRNPNPFNLRGVAINSLIPQGLQGVRVGSHGEKIEEGRWLTTLEPLPDDPGSSVYKDCWADDDIAMAGSGSKLLFFRLRVAEPGVGYFKTLLFGDAPQQSAVARLDVRESSTPTVGGIIGELIFEGEALSDPRFEQHLSKFQIWIEKLDDVTRSLSDEDRRWWDNVTADVPAHRPDLNQARLAILSRIPPLYDLRRRLERPGDPLRRSFRGGLFKRA
jgi:hypothetical protein